MHARRPRLVIGNTFALEIRDALATALPEYDVVACAPEQLPEQAAGARVIVPSRGRVDGAVLDRAPNCRLVQQFGAGLDGVDIAAATARRVPVANVPTRGSGNAESVAELAMLFLLGLARDLRTLQRLAYAGDFGAPVGRTLRGSQVGIVGLGGIGQTLAELLRPFGCSVSAISRRRDDALVDRFGLVWHGDMHDLPRLLRESEYVVLALPLTPETHALIGAAELAMMKPDAVLVNVARGRLVDQTALLEALRGGRLRGAGLDVFWDEPTAPDEPLFEHNVLATPHVGGVTRLFIGQTARLVAHNVRRLDTGQHLLNCVNPAASA